MPPGSMMTSPPCCTVSATGHRGHRPSSASRHIRLDGGKPEQVTELRPSQTVGVVEPSAVIDEERPPTRGLLRIRPRRRHPLERHRHHAHAERVDRLGFLLQLQQVSSAGQSVQMPVQDQQEPAPAIHLKGMLAPARVTKSKRNGGLAESNLRSRHRGRL